jgi:hypothetical protein
MTPQNDIFSCRNQPQVPPKDDEPVDVLTHARHAPTFFFNLFNLLKDKTNPHFIQ